MNYRRALEFAEVQHCREAAVVVLQLTPSEHQDDNDPAMVMCKIKVRHGITPDDCNSDCPLKGKVK